MRLAHDFIANLLFLRKNVKKKVADILRRVISIKRQNLLTTCYTHENIQFCSGNDPFAVSCVKFSKSVTQTLTSVVRFFAPKHRQYVSFYVKYKETKPQVRIALWPASFRTFPGLHEPPLPSY